MNILFLLLIGVPAIEIFIMIKVGQNIGALNTISIIFLTAIIGIYLAKITGLNTLRSAIYKLGKNKDQIPIFEIISGVWSLSGKYISFIVLFERISILISF